MVETQRKRYWTAEGPAPAIEPLPMHSAMVIALDLLIALLVAAALFLVGLRGMLGGIMHHDAVSARVTCIVICLAGTAGYGLLAASLSRAGRVTGAGWQLVLVVVGLIFTVVIGSTAFSGPYLDDPRPGQRVGPHSGVPTAPTTSARMICYSGSGCSIDGTPVPGSP